MFASPRNQLPLSRFAHPSLNSVPPSRHRRLQSTQPPPPPRREPTSLEHELDRVCVSNRSFWTKKIHGLCTHHRNVDEALRLLDHLRLRGYRPDSLNLSSVIHALCDANRFEEARRRFVSFVSSGHVVPDERTCNTIVARLLDSRDPHGTLRVIRCLADVKPGYACSLTNFNRLIDQWCCISKPGYGHRVFLDMKSWGHRPSCVSYTTLIKGYCKLGYVRAAQKLFDEMVEEGIRPNSLTYSALVGGFLRWRDGERAREFTVRLWEVMKCEEDSFVSNAAFADLIDSLCREGFFDEVFQIAESMPQGLKAVAEEHAYGQMIDSLCKVGRHHGASRIVYIMRKRGISLSLASYNSIVHGLSRQGACMRAYQLLKEGIEFGYLPSEYTYKVLVEALCQESDVPKAREVLQVMLNEEGVQKTRVYNIYLRALCLMNNPTELLNVLVSMLQSNCQPDVISLNTVIHGFCKTGRVEDALKIVHDMITGKFCAPDAVTFTTVISGLLDVGKSLEALDLLHHAVLAENSKPSVVTYNAVLRGLFKLGKVKEAEDIFISMKNHGVAANCMTYSILIDGLCNCNQVDKAKRLWDNVIWPSKMHDNHVYAALLKGICISGDLDGACHFLYELVDSGVSPNIFCYNILIDKACKLGLKREAYQILGEMKKNGLAPDAVTWRTLDKLHSSVKVGSYAEDSTSQSEGSLPELIREERLEYS
ncbi:hypothetical protein BT93_F0172 [Corymbia citriodora subsp. variegata]|nr:hypothetical protein BT93_F0172 [Corymbia citriodora subsp. variegata]